MKRLLLLLLAALLLCACQPTPEVDAVRQKNQEAMLEMARGEETDTVENQNVPESGAALPTLDYYALYGIPEHLSEEISGLSDKVKIVVDADVNVPDRPMPIVRAVPTDFSQEQVYDLWNRLVGDRKLFIRDEKETKETIKSQIERCMEILNGPEKNDYEPGEIEQRLEDLKARFNDAPDAEPAKEADGTLIIGEMRDDRGRVVAHRSELKAYEPGGGLNFTVQNSFDNKETIRESDGAITVLKNASFDWRFGTEKHPFDRDWRGQYTSYSLKASDPLPDEAQAYIRSTPADMQARTDAILEQMGLTGSFAVNEITLYPCLDPWTEELIGYGYQVNCTRLVNGVPVCTNNGLQMNLFSMEDMTAPEWLYEYFYLWLDDGDGANLHWMQPVEIQEVIQQNCHLLPFSEIWSVVESRLPMLLERRASSERVLNCTANIHRVDLGLWRIREKNTIETGLLVPVYCFYMDLWYEQDFGNEKTSDVLIVNAVDGTVIDPWNGY